MTKEGIERDLSAESPGLKHVERYLEALEEMWLCQQEFDGFADKWRKLLTRSSGTDVAGKLRQIYQPETAERGPSVTRDVQSEVRTTMERWMKSDVDERLRPDESTKEKLPSLLAAAAAQNLYSTDVEELLDWITRRIDAGLNDLGMPHRTLTEIQ
ncbi:unnamed protein product [Amoebophrya sp. A25]|nr:unnamed protein product [Amoebophrya sp. A25]|eukprot:GSA25T00024192001.1